MLEITPTVVLGADELEEQFIRAPGAGGQKVNKTATAVQLRFFARNSPALSNAAYLRLKKLAGKRMTQSGELVLTANQFRTQEQNRRDARERLVALIRKALVPPTKRRKTRPTLASKKRRLETKKHQASIKKGRGKVQID